MLSEACELEHGLACSYLYAAFSLKRRSDEGGITTEQLHQATLWAAQIFFVASQEMLHLAQAWNLLSAIGATPYCLRPNLPQNSRYYPLHARLALEPFGEKSLKRFIVYETPAQAEAEWVCRQAKLSRAEVNRGHVSIGQLYGAIAEGFREIPNLFIGNAKNQVSRESIQFPEIVQVGDTDSALRAVGMITSQGEGTVPDRIDCHYGVFLTILKDFRAAQKNGGGQYRPVRPVMLNPVANSDDGYGAAAHPIKNALARRTAELFDAVYLLMLQALGFAFTPSADAATAGRAAHAAIELMTAVIRPLGDGLCCLPSGVKGLNGGPAFGLTRFIALPADPKIAMSAIRERLSQLQSEAQRLSSSLPATPQLAVAAARLGDIASRCAS